MVLLRGELAVDIVSADYEGKKGFVGFEVFTEVVMKSSALGRFIAQAVSRWLPTAAARVRTRV
jgi:hypothetical protein